MEQLYVELLISTTTFTWCIGVSRGSLRRSPQWDGYLFIPRIKSPKGAIVAGFEVIYLDNSVNIRL